jgi:polyene glycosyltransferase
MDQARRPILFAGLPEAGLLNPLLVLAGELARQGVPDVWLATDEHRRADVEKLAAKSVVEFASLGEVIPELSAVSWDDEVYQEVTQSSRFKAHRAVVRKSYRPELQARKFRELAAVVEKVRPALMVVDSTSAFAIDVALAKDIPFVLSVTYMPSHVLASHNPFSPSPYTSRRFPVPNSGLPHGMTFAQRVANTLFKLRTFGMFLTPSMGKVLAEDGRIRKELGITPPSPMTRVERAELILCNSVPELDYPLRYPETMKLVGTMVPPLPEAGDGQELREWLDGHPSVVYAGFGTITRLTREQVASMVEVARRLEGEHQVLWKLPAEQQHLLPPRESLPGNLRVESWVASQFDVLSHPNVKLFFTHGGGNGFHEGLYFGKPLVVRPLWVDCFDQAVRGADFGVSLTLDRPPAMDPDDVVDKLTRVLTDRSFSERARRIADLMQAAGGRTKAADLILGLPALA